jgi:hypothetical protein
VRARADQDREIRRGDLLQIKLDHHVLGNLPAFEGSILQAVKPSLHVGNPAFEPCYKGFALQNPPSYNLEQVIQRVREVKTINKASE